MGYRRASLFGSLRKCLNPKLGLTKPRRVGKKDYIGHFKKSFLNKIYFKKFIKGLEPLIYSLKNNANMKNFKKIILDCLKIYY